MERAGLPDNIVTLALPRWRVAYVPIPKAGCTSMLWALAAVAGQEPGALGQSVSPEVTRALTIHDASRWTDLTQLWELSDEDLRAVGPDNGWFVFATTRHPLTRLWSAWQSKLLLREPLYAQRYGDRDWFPRVPRSLAEVQEDFQRYVIALSGDPTLVEADPHWQPQHRVLRTADLEYTHIGRIESLDETYRLLDEHLRRQGWAGELVRQRENRSPLPLLPGCLAPAVVGAVESVYHTDYELFGYPSTPAVSHRRHDAAGEAVDGPAAVIDAVVQLIARHERIGDLSRRASGLARTGEENEARIGSLSSRVEEGQAEILGMRSREQEIRRRLDQTAAERKALDEQLADARQRLHTALDELQLLKGSRTFRYTAPARRVYARLLQAMKRA